jgi:NTE family protein
MVLRELGRGEVLGELGILIDAPRSASVLAVRDSTLIRLTKGEFEKIADAGDFAALVRVLARRLHQNQPPTVRRPPSPAVVVAVVGVDANALVSMVATGLITALSARLRVVNPGRVDRDGLERAERAADKVVLHAGTDDADWREFCLRSADRVVFVAGDPAPPSEALPARAVNADLVLTGPPASRDDRRAWEELITPRSVHIVRPHTGPLICVRSPRASRAARSGWFSAVVPRGCSPILAS